MRITNKTLWRGRTGNDKTYFHPRATRLSERNSDNLIMTLQEITGSDYFHPVQVSFSKDRGETWIDPEPIPGFGRKPLDDNLEDGVCDVVPDFHPMTGKIIATGHNVYYKNNHLYDSLKDFSSEEENDKLLQRFPVYNVRDQSGEWLPERKRLQADDFSDCSIFSCGCSQKVILPDGDMLIPVTFGYFGRKDRMVSSILCSFDGEGLTCIEKGTNLELPAGRGLLEPSLVFHDAAYYMTIRAEDGHGHVITSDDGLTWSPITPWSFDDGTQIAMSTTQQHWLTLDGKLHLVYTRKDETNLNVPRWRSPLFIAEVNTGTLTLKKETEQVVFPLVGDGVNELRQVPLMGNFNTTDLSDTEAIITVGEMTPQPGYIGDTLLARLLP